MDYYFQYGKYMCTDHEHTTQAARIVQKASIEVYRQRAQEGNTSHRTGKKRKEEKWGAPTALYSGFYGGCVLGSRIGYVYYLTIELTV